MMLAQWHGRSPFHSAHAIPTRSHRPFKSARNDFTGMTTMLTPLREHMAEIMKNKLFPPPVLITITIRRSRRMMASSPGCCNPRNCTNHKLYISELPPVSISKNSKKLFKKLNPRETTCLLASLTKSRLARKKKTNSRKILKSGLGILVSFLVFSTSLLDHSTSEDEYELLLVNVLAVLGLDQRGFRGSDSYPSILSLFLKISRFLVLRLAFENSSSIENNLNDLDSTSSTFNTPDQYFSEADLAADPLLRLRTLVD